MEYLPSLERTTAGNGFLSRRWVTRGVLRLNERELNVA